MFYVYIEQDGMYVTQSLLITDVLSKELRKDWYMIQSNEHLDKLLGYCYRFLFDWNCKEVKINLEDEYTLQISDIKIMAPEYFI